jgi:hypothetical protein
VNPSTRELLAKYDEEKGKKYLELHVLGRFVI